MRTIFPQGPLAPAAEALLTSLIKNEASLLPENARFRDKGFKWTQDLKNAVWKTSVERWRDGEGHWEGAVVLLGVPFT